MTEKIIVTTLVTWEDGEVKVYLPILFSDKDTAKNYANSQIETAKYLNCILQMDVYVDQGLERMEHLSWRKGRE